MRNTKITRIRIKAKTKDQILQELVECDDKIKDYESQIQKATSSIDKLRIHQKLEMQKVNRRQIALQLK